MGVVVDFFVFLFKMIIYFLNWVGKQIDRLDARLAKVYWWTWESEDEFALQPGFFELLGGTVSVVAMCCTFANHTTRYGSALAVWGTLFLSLGFVGFRALCLYNGHEKEKKEMLEATAQWSALGADYQCRIQQYKTISLG